MYKVILVDTFGFLFRSFFALPPLKNKEGFPTGLLMGFANLLMKMQKDGVLQQAIFALEGGDNFRKKIYPEYKATRQEAPQDLKLQLPIAMEWIEKMGLKSVSVAGYEADDVIASLSTLAVKNGYQVEIFSHDKDLYQLISENIALYNPLKKVTIKKEECFLKYGLYPEHLIDFQSLLGDKIDNVPGVPSIGEKTAKKLLEHFGSLDAIYENIDTLESVVSKKAATSLREHKDLAYLSRELVTLRKDVFEDFDFLQQEDDKNPFFAIEEDLERYEFHQILQRVRKKNSKNSFRAKGIGSVGNSVISQDGFMCNAHLITNEKELFAILDSIPKNCLIAYDCETNSLDALHAQMVGFSFCFDGVNGYYVPIMHNYLGVGEQLNPQSAKKAIEKIFSYPVVGHNIKFDLMVAQSNFSLFPTNFIKDTMILAWLLDSASLVGLDALIERFFAKKMIAYSSIVPKGKTFAEIDLKCASEYAAEDAVATYCLYQRLLQEFQVKNLQHLLTLAQDLEFPFIRVLQSMEMQGIKIDVEWFEELQGILATKLVQKESEIFMHAKQQFNINSPKKLSEILFNHLQLRAIRQVKGGYSTDEQTLEEIKDSHPIVPCVMEYRELFKLKNTYVEPMLKLRTKENKIHTSFLQTGTTTGRLSSHSPNLQNIPVRTEMGKQIRRGFVADDNKKLLSVDYSQIELRFLAHFSQDKELIEAFQNNLDVHLKTAQMIFGDEAKDKRHIAKTINFGLIYGMGVRKLAKTLKIKNNEAKEYIERYFDSFPTVKNFLKQEEQKILENGYAQTLLGHRRYFDFINATEFMKSNYLREGINAIFQGSVADLIKLSMIRIHEAFKNSSVKMLLQVHDELIFEVDETEAQSIAKQIEIIMNNIYTLNVPLKCSISIGDSWEALK
ncbi:DNA polymerase I [Helicobacter anatolicus]|uniref:DNA polymerase I n=1 Tax=Helicobacter anatolicus TaxID=2905874 RepID=UPI001E53AA9A|nr:DNA polymerase I [Helicobacter anatolicus]MCE3040457.1 DNA polymerase I [Helicobacter anatolicus]